MNERLDCGQQSPAEQRRRWGQRFGLIVIGFMTGAVAISLPLINRERRGALQYKCSRQLQSLGKVMELYASENGGQLPPTLGALVATQGVSTEVFCCPAAGDAPAANAAAVDQPGGTSYVYLRPGSHLTTLPANAVMIYEPLENHGGLLHLLWSDGQVATLSRDQAKQFLNSLPGAAVPTWSTTQPASLP